MSQPTRLDTLLFPIHVAKFGQAFFGDGSRFGADDPPRRTHTKTMASNALPTKLDRLFTLGDDMISGLDEHEVAVGVKQNTLAVLTPALAAGRAAEAAFGDAKVAKKTANATLTAADKAGKVFIANSRKRLAKFFGESYSAEWAAAGWPENSTGLPTTQEERYNLVVSLKTYFTNHPAHESVDMEATAAIATTTATNITNARATLAQKTAESGQAKAARDTAEANLRKRMDGLVTELETLLSGDDPLWHAFGLNRPADEETPEAPSFTSLIASVPGTLLADWDDALRADHYRVWILIVGVDTEFHAVDSPSDSDATLGGLPSGATVKVRVTSVNDAGESQPGPEATAVVP
jgi:hypothetical protein